MLVTKQDAQEAYVSINSAEEQYASCVAEYHAIMSRLDTIRATVQDAVDTYYAVMNQFNEQEYAVKVAVWNMRDIGMVALD